MIVLGFVIITAGTMVMLWASFQIASLENAQDFTDEWDFWYNPYQDMIDEEYERLRDYYSAVRIGGAFGMAAGVALALGGFILMRKESESIVPIVPVPPTVTGAVNFCEYCGQQISPGAIRCPKCGRTFRHMRHEIGSEQEVR